MGYDGRGHCPMLVDEQCSIYPHRPRACREYDCRVFAAAGVEPGVDQPVLLAQVRRWRFRFPSETDGVEHAALKAAAASLGADPGTPVQVAIRAIEANPLR